MTSTAQRSAQAGQSYSGASDATPAGDEKSISVAGQRNRADDRPETTQAPAAPQDQGPHIAVASSDGSRVNRHLGEADHLLIYNMSSPKPKLVGLRRIPPSTTEGSRWSTLAGLLRDCSLLLVGGIGPMPKSLLGQNGIRVRTVRGRISDILAKIDVDVSDDEESVPFVCGEACHGDQHGCDNRSGETRVHSHHGCFGA